MRRRAVERAALRRSAADRLVTGVLVVVAASGLMSVLPGASQRAVSAATCRLTTFGLAGCGDPGLDLTDVALAPARCRVLASLDAALPEVRVRHLVAAHGLPITISTARSGDVVVSLGDAPQPEPPDVLAGAVRPSRRVAPEVDVPAQAEWFLPRGQGLDELVAAVQDSEHEAVQRRSALGLLGSALDADRRSVPPPNLLVSRLDPRRSPWPAPDPAPEAGIRATGATSPPTDAVTVRTDVPMTSVFHRTPRTSTVVAAVSGAVGGRPVAGALRVTRDPSGAVVSVLLAVVGPSALVGPAPADVPGASIAYVQVPVRTATERQLVDDWLAGRRPATVPLGGLLGLRAPEPADRLGSFLTRAATVTVLTYAGMPPTAVDERVTRELTDGRRQEQADARLVEAAEVAPTSTGAGRRLEVDPACSA